MIKEYHNLSSAASAKVSGSRGNDHISLNSVAFSFVVLLLFYTWFWTMCLGVLGGAALALCVARSQRLRTPITMLKLYLKGLISNERANNSKQHECTACDSENCTRHDPRNSFEPWAGLRIHKQLDQAIEDFYNSILDRFVSSWHIAITRQQFFIDELRHQLRHASAALLRRANKINYSKFIVDKLVPCALHHHSIWVAAQRHHHFSQDISNSLRPNNLYPEHDNLNITPPQDLYIMLNGSNTPSSKKKFKSTKKDNNSDDAHTEHSRRPTNIEMSALEGPLRGCLHPAVRSRSEELKYLRAITMALMPHLLRQDEVQNKVFRVLIREIFAGWVLLPLADLLSDPFIINTLVVLATDDDTMAELPKNPSYRVEFLENFARSSSSQCVRRARLLRVDLETLLTRPDTLYALMQHMKATGQLNLLQFCKDIKPFQMKILNPDLSRNDQVSLFNEAWDLYIRYFEPSSLHAIPFHSNIIDEMRSVLSEGAANVTALQRSRALFQASKFVEKLLDTVYIPRFLHSEEFYRLFFGPRTPTGYQKPNTKKSDAALMAQALRLGSRLRGALRSGAVDGHALDSLVGGAIDVAEAGDVADNMNILRYLDSLAEHTKLEEHDLSNWRIAFTAVDIRQLSPERGASGASRVFTISVHPPGRAGWPVLRSEHDLHLLRAKLVEFHGEQLLQDLILPSRRDNSPLETLRYKYEDFIQRLLRLSLLTTSQLLHIFLTASGDFDVAVQRARLGAGASDISNMYQSVAHRLRKEKGQHLEPFLNSFLLCCDMERYRALKQGSSTVEEAEEVCEAAHDVHETPARDICDDIFGDNFGLVDRWRCERRDAPYQRRLVGFSQCLLYFMTRVMHARAVLCAIVGCAATLLRDVIDRAFLALLNVRLARLLSERRLAHLIRLGHELLFSDLHTARRRSPAEQFELASEQLRACSRTRLARLEPGLERAGQDLLRMLQHPTLNKQLVYSLLDLCVAELFPELLETSAATR